MRRRADGAGFASGTGARLPLPGILHPGKVRREPREDRIMSEQTSGSRSFQEAVEARQDLLKQEWRTFQRERNRLLAEGHKGCFALVKGEDVVGVFADENAALRAGYEQLGMVAFMVKPIVPEEE